MSSILKAFKNSLNYYTLSPPGDTRLRRIILISIYHFTVKSVFLPDFWYQTNVANVFFHFKEKQKWSLAQVRAIVKEFLSHLLDSWISIQDERVKGVINLKTQRAATFKVRNSSWIDFHTLQYYDELYKW